MLDFFTTFSTIIVFLHILSAIIWLGGMIVLRYAIHFSMQNIENPRIKIERSLENLQRFFTFVIPCVFVLLLSAIIMIIALEFKNTPLYTSVIIKEIIWTVMTIIFISVYILRNKAQKAYIMGEIIACKKYLNLISKYLIPINIVFALIAVYLGVVLRGF